MRFITGLMLLISFAANAAHIDEVCQAARYVFPNDSSRSIANPPSFSHDLVLRRNFESREYFVESLDGHLITKSDLPWTAIHKAHDLIWLTTASDLEVYSPTGEKLASFTYNPTLNEAWVARDIVEAGDLLILTRGLAGLLAFNTITRSIEWQTLMPEIESGAPVASAFDGQFLRVAMSTAYEGGFTGIAKVSVADGRVLANSEYDVYRSGVVSVRASAIWDNGRMLINNGGWIHLITKDQLDSGKKIRPRWVAHQIPQNGDIMPHYMMLNGEFWVENNTLIGCGDFTTKIDGKTARASKLFSVKLP